MDETLRKRVQAVADFADAPIGLRHFMQEILAAADAVDDSSLLAICDKTADEYEGLMELGEMYSRLGKFFADRLRTAGVVVRGDAVDDRWEQVEEVLLALRRAGAHSPSCAVRIDGDDCTCGRDDAVRRCDALIAMRRRSVTPSETGDAK